MNQVDTSTNIYYLLCPMNSNAYPLNSWNP